jgi:predicted RNA-binding Zn-ribbon protein involved in translation (DUF1610 family)
MRFRTSALPAAIIPCPKCGVGHFSFRSIQVLPSDLEIEDVVYACKKCGAELICTERSKRPSPQAAYPNS